MKKTKHVEVGAAKKKKRGAGQQGRKERKQKVARGEIESMSFVL